MDIDIVVDWNMATLLPFVVAKIKKNFSIEIIQ
jgi:hypothetical protein